MNLLAKKIFQATLEAIFTYKGHPSVCVIQEVIMSFLLLFHKHKYICFSLEKMVKGRLF